MVSIENIEEVTVEETSEHEETLAAVKPNRRGARSGRIPPIEARFGARIRELRTQLGISQEELSFRAGLHRNYVSDAERGTRNVSLKAIEKFAKGLGVTVKDLF